jgi:hypothetical protein
MAAILVAITSGARFGADPFMRAGRVRHKSLGSLAFLARVRHFRHCGSFIGVWSSDSEISLRALECVVVTATQVEVSHPLGGVRDRNVR